MTITFDSSGNTNLNTSGTSTVVDITSAAVGAWCYALISVGATTSNVITTNASWTRLGALHIPGNTSSEVGLYRRQKQLGDTTFTFNYTSTFKNIVAWSSYLGLDPVTPDDGVGTWLAHDTAVANYDTPSVSNTFTNGWAVALYHARSSAALRTFTSDAALVERQDAACATSVWFGVSIDDSNGPVATGAQSYTATASGTDAGGGGFLIFLNPAVSTVLPPDPVPFALNAPGLYQSPSSVVLPWAGDDARAIPYQDVIAGQPLETDLAQPITAIDGPAWIVTLGQPLETDLAQPVAVVVVPWTIVLGQPSEQDDAQPVGSIRGVADPDPSSVLQVIAPALLFGPPGSTGPQAWPGSDLHDVPVLLGQPQETDIAQPVTVVQGTPWTVTLGQPTETDIAQPVAAVDASTTVAMGQPAETDLAQPVAAVKVANVGQAVSTGVAQPMGQLHAYPDADPTSALAFVAPGLFGSPDSVATPWSGDLAAAVAGQLVGVGQISESDLAQPVTVVHAFTAVVGQTTEIDLAQSMVAINAHVVLVGQPAETDTCQPLTVVHPRTVPVSQAVETDIAQPVSRGATNVPASMSSAPGGSSLSSRLGAQGSDGSQSTDMLSTTDKAAGGLSGV